MPVVLTLSLGGALIATIPANADPADLTVSSATVSGRVFTVTGNATTGDSIELLDANGNFAVQRSTVTDGTYSMSYTIPGTASGPMKFTVQQVTSSLADDGSAPVTADVPASFSVTSPTDGSTVSSRTVTFTGTGTEGQPVNVLTADGTRILQADPTADGSWSGTYTFPNSAATTQQLSANEPNVGADGASRSFTITLPAPAQEFTVTSPKNGDTETSRTVSFTGTGFTGQPVNVLNEAGTRLFQAIPDNDGNWSGTYTFTNTDSTTQNLSANEINVGAAGDSQAFTITLPAATPAAPTFTVTSPKNGDTENSRTVTFTGTGTDGEPVNVLAEDGTRLFQTIPNADGQWSQTYTFPDTAAMTQNLSANELNVGEAGAPIDFTITLPAVTAPVPTVATPVITSPKNGQHVTGGQVTFTGTGTPGANILLAVVPTAEVKAAAAQVAKTQSKIATPNASTPAAPQDPIVVNSKGTWTVTVALKPNDYTAEAQSFLLDNDGQPVTDANGDPVVSGPSNDVEFILAAAATTTTAATGTTTPVATETSANGSLAYTGSNPAPIAGFAGLLLALGGMFTVIARRRRRGMNN